MAFRRYRLSGCLFAGLCTLAIGVAPARAAQINGRLVAYEGGVQQGGRYLHFQNKVTRDCYMVPTTTDGAFGTQLPPGVYDLRAERGAVLARAINVGSADIALGQVSDLAPYAPARLCHLQAIAPSLLSSPAPATANILTADTTVLPPAGRVMAAPIPALPPATPNLAGPAPNLPVPPPGEAPTLEPR